MPKKVLFLAKLGPGYSYSDNTTYHEPSGLLNSSRLIVRMLNKHGVNAKFVQVVDSNSIDKEVASFSPDIVIIEALWVVPEKFTELAKLHPNVQWFVRIHSEVPFLSQEGIAIQWIRSYIRQPNVHVAFNSSNTLRDFLWVFPSSKYLYLPNYFPEFEQEDSISTVRPSERYVDIGSFGAIRPLKNQLIQAMAAISYADSVRKMLAFHINATRVEGGEQILKNLRALFANSKHNLVEHDWLSVEGFENLLARMDVASCVSFSESFCIAAAEAVSLGVPLVCSPQIKWAYSASYADPTNMADIVQTITRVKDSWQSGLIKKLNRRGLKEYDRRSVKFWLEFVK
jgi:hypothetical protein